MTSSYRCQPTKSSRPGRPRGRPEFSKCPATPFASQAEVRLRRDISCFALHLINGSGASQWHSASTISAKLYLSSRIDKRSRMVGDTGIEPVTSTMSTWRSNQSELTARKLCKIPVFPTENRQSIIDRNRNPCFYLRLFSILDFRFLSIFRAESPKNGRRGGGRTLTVYSTEGF